MIVRAVDRITRILATVGDSENGLTNGQLSKALALPKSTLSKNLNSLAQYEWLAFDPVSRRYRLGPRNLFLAAKYIDHLDLVRLGQRFLRRLKRETGEMACMEIPSGDEVVMVAKLAADDARLAGEKFTEEVLRLAELGHRAPLYATASGKCLLASRTDAEIERYIEITRFTPFTKDTITDSGRLRQEIQSTRASGLAYNRRELNPHTIAVAGPVRNLYGRTIGTLAVITPDFRFDHRRKPCIEDAVMRATTDFSKLLGFQGR